MPGPTDRTLSTRLRQLSVPACPVSGLEGLTETRQNRTLPQRDSHEFSCELLGGGRLIHRRSRAQPGPAIMMICLVERPAPTFRTPPDWSRPGALVPGLRQRSATICARAMLSAATRRGLGDDQFVQSQHVARSKIRCPQT